MKSIELQTWKLSTLHNMKRVLLLLLGVPALLVTVIALEHLSFRGVDWLTFQDTLADPWHAYEQPHFFYPPWMLWLVAPLTWLPYSLGLNRLLALTVLTGLVIKRGGGWQQITMLVTSMPLLYLVANANIDWIPALAFMLENKSLALPLLLIKPQTGALAAAAWIRERGEWIVVPTLLVLLVSFGVHGAWIWQMIGHIQTASMPDNPSTGLMQMTWNASLFPWTIPLGLWLLYKTIKNQDEFYGVSATILLAPYFALYTLALWYALFVVRQRNHPMLGWITWALLWIVFGFKHVFGVNWL